MNKPSLMVRYTKRKSVLKRNAIELFNTGDRPLRGLVAGLIGTEVVGVGLLGSPLGELGPNQSVPLFLEPDPRSVKRLHLRVVAECDGELVADDFHIEI